MQQPFQPLGFKMLPNVIKNLLIINFLFFMLSYVSSKSYGEDLSHYLGLYLPTSDNFHWWQYITHMFMHANFSHIAYNMFALWMFGNVIENIWGGKRFLFYYLVTGLGAAIIHLGYSYYEILQIKNELLDQGLSKETISIISKANFENIDAVLRTINISNVDFNLVKKLFLKYNTPTVGASGAVFGILLAFGMTFPNTLIYIYFLIPIKAKWFVIIFGALELFSGLANDPTSNIAHFAHLGGMLFGYILIKMWRKNKDIF